MVPSCSPNGYPYTLGHFVFPRFCVYFFNRCELSESTQFKDFVFAGYINGLEVKIRLFSCSWAQQHCMTPKPKLSCSCYSHGTAHPWRDAQSQRARPVRTTGNGAFFSNSHFSCTIPGITVAIFHVICLSPAIATQQTFGMDSRKTPPSSHMWPSTQLQPAAHWTAGSTPAAHTQWYTSTAVGLCSTSMAKRESVYMYIHTQGTCFAGVGLDPQRSLATPMILWHAETLKNTLFLSLGRQFCFFHRSGQLTRCLSAIWVLPFPPFAPSAFLPHVENSNNSELQDTFSYNVTAIIIFRNTFPIFP